MTSLNILPQYTDYFHLNTATTGLNNAASWMGQIFAAFVLQPIPDRLGRKNAIVISAVICFIGIILQAAAQNVGMFVVARMIVGFGASISSAAAPALIGELMPAQHRGFMLGIFFSCYYVGSLLSSIINYGTQYIESTWSWRLPSVLMTVPSIISLLLLPFIPESPRVSRLFILWTWATESAGEYTSNNSACPMRKLMHVTYSGWSPKGNMSMLVKSLLLFKETATPMRR